MKCPKCGLVCPPQARLCSCGYNFSTALDPKPDVPASRPSHPYVPLTQASRWAMAALIIVAAWSCVCIVLDVRGAGPAHWTFQIAQARATRNFTQLARGAILVPVLVGLALAIASAAAFLVWFHKARRNLPALGADNCQYDQWWAVGGFFIPILNLVRPFQVMREVWNASDPDDKGFLTPVQVHYWRQATPPVVWWWWGLFLASNALPSATVRIARDPWLPTFQTETFLSIASHSVQVIAAVVAVTLVRLVTNRQASRNRARSEHSDVSKGLDAS